MFVNDFDNNGKIEQIFTRKIGGKDVPVHLLKELKSQIYTTKLKISHSQIMLQNQLTHYFLNLF